MLYCHAVACETNGEDCTEESVRDAWGKGIRKRRTILHPGREADKKKKKDHKKERGDFDALRERRSEENGLDYTAYE